MCSGHSSKLCHGRGAARLCRGEGRGAASYLGIRAFKQSHNAVSAQHKEPIQALHEGPVVRGHQEAAAIARQEALHAFHCGKVQIICRLHSITMASPRFCSNLEVST